MTPTCRVDKVLSAHAVIGHVAVGLKQFVELIQECLRSFESAAHAKVEDHATAGNAALPKLRPVVVAAAIVHLHSDRRFVRLNVTSVE